MSGQLPSNAVSSIPGKMPFQHQEQQQQQPHMNVNYQMSARMQNPGVPRRSMDPELLKVRRYMSERIYEFIMRRKRNPYEVSPKKLLEIVKKLEECLFKTSGTMEEYMNLATLDSRIVSILRRPTMNSHNQHNSHANSSSLIGTMIPTPGMPQSGSTSMATSPACNSMVVSSSGNPSASSMVAPVTSLTAISRPAHEAFSYGYQHLHPSFSTGAVRNMCTRVERVPTQMIPTPGFSTAIKDSMNDISNRPCTSNNVSSFSNPDPMILSQPLQQKPRVGGQIRPQTSYGVSNGTLNGGVGMIGNQSNLLTAQPAEKIKQESADHSEKLNYPCDDSFLETLVQPHPHQQFRQQPVPNSQKELQYQNQLNQHHQEKHRYRNQQTQNKQILSKNDHFGQSQVLSDVRGLVKSDPGLDRQNEGPSEQSSHSLLVLSAPDGSLQDQTSQDTQHMECQQQFISDTERECGSLSGGVQSDVKMHNQWHSESKDGSQASVNFHGEQNVCQELSQRLRALNEAQKNNTSENAYMTGKSGAAKSDDPSNVSCSDSRSGNLDREGKYKKQVSWILFLRHARRCPYPVGKCRDPNCETVQILVKHMERCNKSECSYPRCRETKILMKHNQQCTDSSCPVCVEVKNRIAKQLQAYSRSGRLPQPNSVNGSCKPYAISTGACKVAWRNGPGVDDNSVNLEPSPKRLKTEQSSPTACNTGMNRELVHYSRELHVLQEICPVGENYNITMPVKHESTKVKMEFPGVDERSRDITEVKQLKTEDYRIHRSDIDANMLKNPTTLAAQINVKVETDVSDLKHDIISVSTENLSATKSENPSVTKSENPSAAKSEKPKLKGVSLTELFTPEQVRDHIRGLRRWVGQSKAKAEKNQALEHSMSENSCQLCAVEKLSFEPPPIYCSPCGARIKRNATYYTIGANETRHYFCMSCYNESRGDTIPIDGSDIPKARMEKKKNDEETEEGWVQCDKCEAWQHQICALFNGRRNDDGQAEYICPKCYIEEVEAGERMPLPQSAVLGAKDLPKTILSDHIEKRLAQKLKQERQERAKFHGKNYDEVPGADGLVVRVVSSVDKKLEVKPRFLEIFKEENYSTEFQYKSKVLLLFQKIEGVEVCLFGIYAQEFGSECQHPNHRRVYLSYLDSVKYFMPEVKTISGEALRTYVYHEILIGYLEYCKLRGFTSCYIWACPPLKGEDYILYCHPEIQKTPKSDKLREWYLSMLRKATRENIVTELTNLYDHFFVTTGECRAKVTAARLPYFDGDYWPGAAEDIICQLQQEEEGRKQPKKGVCKKNISKRALKACAQTDLSGNISKDLLLMRKLGETICAMKEDFIMVHLQHACSHCCTLMVSGNRWVCNICLNFQLCDTCYEAEQKREERDWHPINQKEKHPLSPVAINGVPEDTKDEDEILESEFFDTRQAFLSLCQGNHYQYDTLRRAKHSSMMVLYHLHNPSAPAYVSTCNVCHLDIESGQGWRCETCPDYDVCNSCYIKDCGINHPHKLTNHPSMADRDAQNKEARQLRVTQLKKMLELLVHASLCRSLLCEYPNCRKVKGLFRHGMHCNIRASAGCVLCKKMWHLLQLHARACKEPECHVPRCRDLKEHFKRLQLQSDSRRRAAVMEMMRQRAAEVAGNHPTSR